MLKDAGVDRFVVPKMLAELDPEQIENFERIYERHAGALTRHLDHVRFLETFLQNKTWSEALEEELLPELPWPEGRLKEMSPPLDPVEQGLSRRLSRPEARELAAAISRITPLHLTGLLASLVRVLLEDWTALKDAESALHNSDPQLQGEAALVLANWRVVYGPGVPCDRYRLIDALRACPFRSRAAVALAIFGDKAQPIAEALVSSDPDLSFTAAIAAGDADRLVAAERDSDPLKRYVAAWVLVDRGIFTGVAEVLRETTPERQLELLKRVQLRKKPATPLREVVFELMDASKSRDLRPDLVRDLKRHAVIAALSAWEPGDTLRIARSAGGEAQVRQALLQTPAIPPDDLAEACRYFLEQGVFAADQWGMSDAARPGRLPIDFVPKSWNAANERGRVEMCKVAEMQLEAHGADSAAIEPLHRFLVNTLLREDTFAVQQQAWVSVFRWYRRLNPRRGSGPLKIQEDSLKRFFGSVNAFVPLLTRFLGSGAPGPILQDLFVREPLDELIRYAAPDVVPDLSGDPGLALELAESLRGVMQSRECEFTLRLACIELLTIMTQAKPLRERAIEILVGFRGTDLDLGVSTAMERIL